MNTNLPKTRGITFRFFRFIWRFLWGSLKALNTLLFGLLALLLISILVFALFKQREPAIPDGVALVLNPSGTLVEQKTEVGAAAALQGGNLPQQALVKDIVDALALAKQDDKIGLVVLKLDKLQNGLMPKLERVAAAIADFRASGKKVIAVSNNYGQSAIYLAAQADEILLNPEGVALVEGFAVYNTYFKSLLDDNDVSVNLFKVGKYKSAAESFVRDDMSPEAKEAWLAIIDSWWATYTDGVETARALDAGSIDNLLQSLPEQLQAADGNLAQLALQAGLVDRLVTDNQKRDYLIELAGEDTETEDFRGITYSDYLRTTRTPDEAGDSKIAIVTAVGNIVDGEAPAGTIGSESLTSLIRKARLDEKVKAIVLRVDSGGGSKSASEMIRSELQAAQSSGIPLVVSMGSVAGSGGYWIAASADEIWASPTTITGSIGVIGLMPGFEKALARYGVFTDGVATTPIAGVSPVRELSPELSEVIQLTIDSAYQQFLSTVAEGRDMDVNAVDEIAQGRIWTGEAAQQLGLVDELGDLEEAIVAAAKLADVDDYSEWYVQPELSFEDMLVQRLMSTVSGAIPPSTNTYLNRIVSKFRRELGILSTLNDPRNTYVICTDCPVVH